MPFITIPGLDRYSIQARILPACVIVTPIALLVHSYAAPIIAGELKSFGIMTFAVITLALMLAPTVRDFGAQKEETLKKKWKGMPTTILLTKKSKIFNEQARTRYASILKNALAVRDGIDPTYDNETKNFDVEAGVAYLRECTRGPSFSIIHSENAEYGMRRNLLGTRRIGLVVSVLCLVAHLGLDLVPLTPLLSLKQFWAATHLNLPSYILLICCLLIWIFLVTEKWVRAAGDKYSKALIQALDTPGLFKAPLQG
jgi:hypothetical protein